MNDTSELRVFIVDDSDFSRNTLKNLLSEEKINVVGEASDAESALKILKEKKPNVVITDIVMPEISGIELTENIVKNFKDIDVIVISSLSQEHIILDAIGAGASDFISKPISRDQLIDSLKKIIINRQME